MDADFKNKLKNTYFTFQKAFTEQLLIYIYILVHNKNMKEF